MSVEQTKPPTVTVEQADAFIAENCVAGRPFAALAGRLLDRQTALLVSTTAPDAIRIGWWHRP
jgi:hypothetical protein